MRHSSVFFVLISLLLVVGPQSTNAIAQETEEVARKIVFLAGAPSHGYGSHEHYAGCARLAKSLQAGMPNFDIELVRDGWPEDESVFDGADCVEVGAVAVGVESADRNQRRARCDTVVLAGRRCFRRDDS